MAENPQAPTKPAPSNLSESNSEDEEKVMVNIGALPVEVLGQTFSLLPQRERAYTALVCKRWADIGRSSRVMWQSGIRFEIYLNSPGSIEKSEGFVKWLIPRAPNINSLTIISQNPAGVENPALAQIEALVGANITAALAVTGPYLRDLVMNWDGSLLLSGWAATLTSLCTASFTADDLTVRPGLGSISSLQDLRLKSINTPLTFLGPNDILLPSNLKALRMDGCRLQQLPPAVANLRNLTDLVLSNNQLAPDELEPLSKMTKLEQLTLMGTRMAHLPRSLSTLSRLRVLYLDGVAGGASTDVGTTTADQISAAIGTLRQLGILSLGSSRLTDFPIELTGFSSLRVLYLDNNPMLTVLPDGVYLRRLRVLGLDWRVLFASHNVLNGAPLLQKMCITAFGGIEQVPLEERESDAVADTLLNHPCLSQVLLPMVDGNRVPLYITALNLTLRLAAHPRIKVRAVTYSGIGNEWVEYLDELEKQQEPC